MGEWRGEEDGQHGEIFGLSVGPRRDLCRGMGLAILFGVVAPDLLAHDPPGRDRVDGDPISPDIARQPLGPRVNCRLGGKGGVEPVGFRFAGDVDDPTPAAQLTRMSTWPSPESAASRNLLAASATTMSWVMSTGRGPCPRSISLASS